MKSKLLRYACFLLAFLLSGFVSSAQGELSVTQHNTQEISEIQSIADQAIAHEFPFEPKLYECVVTVIGKNEYQLNYHWKRSDFEIFSVLVRPDKQLEISFNSEHTLNDYYRHLRRVFDGFFRNWSVEDKAWFADILPAHLLLDQYREHTLHPDWSWEMPSFAITIMAHAHGIPDSGAIPQDKAYELAENFARKYLGDAEKDIYGSTVSTFYYTDDNSKPKWVFRFYKGSIRLTEVWLDAHSGNPSQTSRDAAFQTCKKWLIDQRMMDEATIDSFIWASYLQNNGVGEGIWVFKVLLSNLKEPIELRVSDTTGLLLSK